MSLVDYINQQVKASLITFPGTRIRQVKVSSNMDEKDIRKPGTKLVNISLKIIGSYDISKKEFSEDYLLPVKIKHMACSACRKERSSYFESVLQLRNPSKPAVDFIESYIEKHRDRVNITKKEEVRGGLDFYLTERQAAAKLARLVSEGFGGEIKVAEKLFSFDHSSGKDLYRVNALVRLPDFAVGDVLEVQKNLIKITSLGPKLTGLNLMSGKSQHFDYSDLEYVPVQTFEAVVSKTYPVLEVIHPETFQSVRVKNSVNTSRKKVRVAVSGDDVWLVE
jgi:NMD protein affecting ribosome stability and mRNA decay